MWWVAFHPVHGWEAHSRGEGDSPKKNPIFPSEERAPAPWQGLGWAARMLLQGDGVILSFFLTV